MQYVDGLLCSLLLLAIALWWHGCEFEFCLASEMFVLANVIGIRGKAR
jgi:hypothetical protein